MKCRSFLSTTSRQIYFILSIWQMPKTVQDSRPLVWQSSSNHNLSDFNLDWPKETHGYHLEYLCRRIPYSHIFELILWEMDPVSCAWYPWKGHHSNEIVDWRWGRWFPSHPLATAVSRSIYSCLHFGNDDKSGTLSHDQIGRYVFARQKFLLFHFSVQIPRVWFAQNPSFIKWMFFFSQRSVFPEMFSKFSPEPNRWQ